MNQYEIALWESKIEGAENAIRSQHNHLESRRWFGRKNYMPYHNEKLLVMISETSKLIKDLKE
jgi:hypothetical protein